MTANEYIQDFKSQGIGDTVADVRGVLSAIGKPGEFRELKAEVVGKLFTKQSFQGFTTVDTLEDYEEF